MPKISIIIPIYNVEIYLEETIKSVLAQTFTDFELILVDDGSTDKSGEICDKYAESDNRIVVIHKENGGVSSARNTGLEAAKGEYIGFVDSDDLIDQNMFQLLFAAAKKEDADIVQCEHDREYPTTLQTDFTCAQISPKDFINLQFTLKGDRCTNILALWSKIYKRELFKGLVFPKGRVYEDHALMCQIAAKAKKILISDAPLYHYIKRENSIITGFSQKKCQDKILALLDNCVFLREYDRNLYEKSVTALRNCVFNFCHRAEKSERDFYFNFIKKHRNNLSLNASIYDKVYLSLISLGIFKHYIANNDFEPIQKKLQEIKKLLHLISFIKQLRHKIYIEFYRLRPIQKNKIIFWSNNLKSYGCNPKYIAQYLNENYPKEYDIVWAFNEETALPDDLPENFRIVKFFSLNFLKELHTAKIIITNTRMSEALMFKKRKGQFYIQTWHSSLRLKKIEGDTELPESYIESAKKDSKNIDLLISGSKFSTDCFRRAFWYNGEIFESGTPRCDVLLQDNTTIKAKVCKQFGIDLNSKIALFAPTFRKNYKENDLGLDYESLKSTLEDRFGGNWSIIYRYHPNVVKKDHTGTNPIWLKDGSKYSDMQELLTSSDILITDYSSCMFDAAIKKIPCFLYAPDFENYLQNERQLYFDIKSLPFSLALNNQELTDTILKFDNNNYQANISKFLKATGSFEDGKASEKISEKIKQII